MAPDQKAAWFKLENVGLGNFGPEPGDEEDRVQVAITWQWPDALDGLAVSHLREVQRRVSEKPRRKDSRSPNWIGFLIIETLGLDRENKSHRAKAKSIFDTWRENRMFKIVVREDENRRDREYVEVDQRAND